MSVYEQRLADPKDSLRALLEAARRWQVPPSVFMRWRTVDSREWTDLDTRLAMALENFEASLCPGGDHVLAETARPEHEDAYRPGERTRCHYCKAKALLSESLAEDGDSAGVMVPLVLDPDVVELNLQPVPELPPELAALATT